MEKNKRIEVLRGILVLMIVFFHYTYRFSEIYNIETIDFFSLKYWGTIGVGCFFIITGYFLLPKTFESYSCKKFIFKKISRLYPAYILCMTLTFISVQIWGLEGRETNFFDYLLNVIMLNGFINTKYVDGAHWYLTYLLIFYIILGIVLKYTKNSKVYLTVWLIVKDIMKVLTIIFHDLSPLYMLIGGNYVEYIIIGIALKEFLKKYSDEKESFNKLIKKQFIYIILIVVSILQIGVLENIPVMIGIILFICLFVYWGILKKDDKQISKHNFLYFIGGISYIIYLIHQNIGYQMLLGIFNATGDISLIYIVIVAIIIISISFILECFFEKPIQNFLKLRRNNIS